MAIKKVYFLLNLQSNENEYFEQSGDENLKISNGRLFILAYVGLRRAMIMSGTRCSYRCPCNSSDKKLRNFLSVKLAYLDTSFTDNVEGKKVSETGVEKAVFG